MMDFNILQQAFDQQGEECAWRGDIPSSVDQITQEYLDEDVNGFPRYRGGPVDVAQLKADIAALLQVDEKDRINAERDRRIASLTVELDGVTYDADIEARANLTSTVSAINANVIPVPDPLDWRDANNVTRQLSHLKVLELAGLMFAAVDVVYKTSWDLKAQIDAAPDLATAQAVTWP